MTAAVIQIRHRSRPGRSWRLGLATGLLAAALAVAGGAINDLYGTPSRTATARLSVERTQLAGWEAVLYPLLQTGGQVVVTGAKPGVADIIHHTLPNPVLHQMAAGWAGELAALDRRVAALDPPSFLRPAAGLFDQAMAGYVTTAQDLLAATTAAGTRRAALVSAAETAGTHADRLYDRATAQLASWRHRLGLPPDWSA